MALMIGKGGITPNVTLKMGNEGYLEWGGGVLRIMVPTLGVGRR